jgi:hypothetical protein
MINRLTFELPEGFRFSEEDHSYWVQDRRIPGLTETIGKAGLYPFPVESGGLLSDAMIRGWIVHKALDGWYKGDTEETPPEIEAYVESEARFVKHSGFEVRLSEVPLCNPALWYGCTPDRVGMLNGKLVVIDSKTGPSCPAYHVQLAGNFFALTALKVPIEGAFLLELKSTGQMARLSPIKDFAEHWEVFIHALGCEKWRRKYVNSGRS